MATRSHEERPDRLERIVQVIAEDQLSLQKIVADLATETRRAFDQVGAQFAETDRRFAAERAETDRRVAAERAGVDQRTRQLDERIDKRVVAIGEFIRRQNDKKA